MVTRHQRRFVAAQTGWILLSIITLMLLDVLSLQSVFVLSLIGLLVAAELTAPYAVVLRWRIRLRRVVAFGLVVFGLLVLRRVLSLLPAGV